jgi:TolB protein
MMRRLVLAISVVSVASALLVAAPYTPDVVRSLPLQDPQKPPQTQGEIVLTASNKGLHPNVGVPDFAVAGNAAVSDAAKLIGDVLWSDLEYEREFYMINRKSSAGIPAAATPRDLPFSQWTQIGADFVLMGSVKSSGATLAVEIRLIGIRGDNPGRQEFGQTYQGCTIENARYCAHSIADDMHKTLRDLDGVARTKIAFTSDREPARMTSRPLQDSGQSKEIYIMDYDGANVRAITVNKSLNIGPSWGPDGRMLAWASYTSQYPDIYVSTLDGRPVTRPAQGTESIHNQSPAISPDGTKIAFSSSRGGRAGYFDIWVVNRDGTNPRNLTADTADSSEGAPTWSPAGNQIAYTSDKPGSNQIYLMNADGTGRRRLTFEQQADRPTWSAKNFIAYTLRQPAGHDIAMLSLTESAPRILTNGRGSNRQPTVSPNGRHVVFVTTQWGKEHLASIDIDGKNIKQLTTVGNNTYPNWSPSPGR